MLTFAESPFKVLDDHLRVSLYGGRHITTIGHAVALAYNLMARAVSYTNAKTGESSVMSTKGGQMKKCIEVTAILQLDVSEPNGQPNRENGPMWVTPKEAAAIALELFSVCEQWFHREAAQGDQGQ